MLSTVMMAQTTNSKKKGKKKPPGKRPPQRPPTAQARKPPAQPAGKRPPAKPAGRRPPAKQAGRRPPAKPAAKRPPARTAGKRSPARPTGKGKGVPIRKGKPGTGTIETWVLTTADGRVLSEVMKDKPVSTTAAKKRRVNAAIGAPAYGDIKAEAKPRRRKKCAPEQAPKQVDDDTFEVDWDDEEEEELDLSAEICDDEEDESDDMDVYSISSDKNWSMMDYASDLRDDEEEEETSEYGYDLGSGEYSLPTVERDDSYLEEIMGKMKESQEKVEKEVLEVKEEPKAKTTKKKYSIEEILIMTNEGMLMQHFSSGSSSTIDEDILAGMLTAIQMFVRDTFETDGAELSDLYLGQFKIILTRGKYLHIATVMTGDDAKPVKKQMNLLVKDLERKYWRVLRGWDGDMDGVKGMKGMVNDLLEGKYG